MGSKKRIGVLNDKPVSSLRCRQISRDIAHFQKQHPVFLECVSDSRCKRGILNPPRRAGNHPAPVFQQPFQYLSFFRRMPSAEIDIRIGQPADFRRIYFCSNVANQAEPGFPVIACICWFCNLIVLVYVDQWPHATHGDQPSLKWQMFFGWLDLCGVGRGSGGRIDHQCGALRAPQMENAPWTDLG